MTSKMLQELDFSQSPLCKDLFTKHIGDLFNGHTLTSLVMRCRAKDEGKAMYQHRVQTLIYSMRITFG